MSVKIDFEEKKAKKCAKCGGIMALFWQERKRSEGAYAPERMHNLVCSSCGYGRTERFINADEYPLLIVPAEGKGLQLVNNNSKDGLPSRPIDPTVIGTSE